MFILYRRYYRVPGDRDEWAWRNTMWKVFWLHRDLLLDDIGKLILGIVSLVRRLIALLAFI